LAALPVDGLGAELLSPLDVSVDVVAATLLSPGPAEPPLLEPAPSPDEAERESVL
jgi:hypothetical protein